MKYPLLKICLSVVFVGTLPFFERCALAPTEPEPDNPWHTEKPEVTVMYPANGDTVTARDVTVAWKSGNEVTTEYSFRIDNSSWEGTTETSVTLRDLEEGPHTFHIIPENEYENGETVTRTFIIDAIEGPGISFAPRKITTSSYISVYLEDVAHLLGAHIEVTVTNSCAVIGEFIPDGADSIKVFTGSPDSYRLVIDIVHLGGSTGISGTLHIGRFTVSPGTSGEITIDPDKTVFRDIENSSIAINSRGLDEVRVYK